jgi:hypothetical protein
MYDDKECVSQRMIDIPRVILLLDIFIIEEMMSIEC